MAWIESHQELARHPKTRRLARLLDVSVPTAIGHLHLLWWWALDYAEDGDVSGFEPLDLAEAALWEGKPDLFASALGESRFLNADGQINDWDEYAGKLVDKRKANAERMREARSARKKDVPEQRAAHVQRTLHARAGATVPNRTEQNSREPENESTVEPATDAAPPEIQAPTVIPKTRELSPDLALLQGCFVERGLRAPPLIASSEQLAAKRLLKLAREPDQLAACFQDIRAGEYGDSWLQQNLSFVALDRNNRFANWQASKEGGASAGAPAHWSQQRNGSSRSLEEKRRLGIIHG